MEVSTWICAPGGSAVDAARATRFISREGVPHFRLPEPRLESAGGCRRLTDTIDTRALPNGRYAYQLEWSPSEAADGWKADLDFEVARAPVP